MEGRGGGMCGDVNFFFNDPDEPKTVEIEVMVAEEGSRRKGLAREALLLMMVFASSRLGVDKFRCGGRLPGLAPSALE